MASKASMLQKAANNTGKGLFAGMTKLDTREEEPQTENEVTNDIDKLTGEVTEKAARRPVEPEVKQPEVVKTVEEPKKEPVTPVKVVEEKEPAVKKEINVEINKPEETAQSQKEKTNSRYEKETVLLLDVRGCVEYQSYLV